MKKSALALLLAMTTTAALADDAQITSELKKLGVNEIQITSSPLAGIKTAVTDKGIVYVSEDGKYVLYGNLYQITDKGAVNMSNKLLFEQVEKLSNQMIVYPAKNEKYVVTVFMDITCHYCHLLHEQMKDYNDLGITVRYLAFPREGLGGQVAQQMESIWVAKDPVFALNEAEKGNLPKELHAPQMVTKHYQLGLQYGVNGTPSIILPNGELLGGYVPPKELLKVLQSL
ncbi:protein-disulfide isomerase [Gallibacterium genomosp. 3]|uniref:Thiol:disulfide interchange protein n=1 Tax=Gallibacterium genomosp. 3 TaxID=505345 RepID=A0A1A7PRX5_9PAST|nr:bifunctional protein-disulfide isomerase/oxidoreductase DsbC [Gallibacterium genomosp. 3]OBX04804.1 protein-disulfide isomerase [Gallibacterium genomosp. 3]